ncbi:MAG TPA: ABC transporter ATP-binding protein [Solirubrobacteraceae bacterium]|nr:ABC transporter ATP-binding protein [Solirubrobacteraceae bacterium]
MNGSSVLWQAIAGHRADLVRAAALSVGHQAGEAAVPVLIGVVVDRAIAPRDAGALAEWLVVLAAVFCAFSLSYRFSARFARRAIERSAHDVRVAVAARVLDARGGVDAGRRSGELLTLASQDADRVGMAAQAVVMAAGVASALTVTAVVLVGISWMLGALVLVGLPVLTWALHRVGRPLHERAGAEQAGIAAAAAVAADLIGGLRILKGIGAEAAGAAQYRVESRRALRSALSAARVESLYEGATVLLSGGFLALVALVAAGLAMDGTISVGELIAAVGLTQFLAGPLIRLSWAGRLLIEARASAQRVAGLLAAEPAVVGGTAPVPSGPGSLRLAGVAAGPVRDLTLDVPAGSIVGIAATEPASALALLDALGRRTDPDAGTITLDGAPLADLDLHEALGAVTVVPHESELFEGTLADNVAAAARNGSRLAPALRAAAVHEVAEAIPDGLDGSVGERGRLLSGGQRQRVALARALAADPPVLVLHDPTTAVDPATEAAICAGLRSLRAGRTTVLVATSAALLSIADHVVLVDGGAVTAEGTHAELVATNPRYREVVL